MSSTKRQSSWQEDIARNFSRLFLRSKSQEPQKTGNDGSDISSNVEDEESSSPSSELREQDPQEKVVLELSKAVFHGSEGERQEGAEVGEEEKKEEEGGEGSGVLDDAGGSPSRLAPASPPRSPAASGPSTPTAPLDAFFRKLGSLFHLSSRTEAGTAVEEEAPADADAPGMARAPGGSGDAAEPSGSPAGGSDTDTDRPLQEGWETGRGRGGGEGESGEQNRTPPPLSSADPESPALTGTPEQPPEECAQTDLPAPQHLVLYDKAGEDHNVADQEHGADTDLTLEEAADEQRRRLALSRPPIVTYGTYRGSREIRRMRRRNEVQVGSPISEGEELQHSFDSAARLSPPGEDARGAAVLECAGSEGEQPGTLAGDAVAVTPARPGPGGVPVMMPSEDDESQSALLPERETDLARAPAQATDSCPGGVSGVLSMSAAERDSSDKRTSPAEEGGKAERLEEQASLETAEAIAREMKLATERAETLSTREGSTGSPSKASDSAAPSHTHGSQCNLNLISPSDTQEDEGSEVPVPADQGLDAPESSLTAGKSRLFAPETGLIEEGEPDEMALWYESRQMVDNILRNALTALQNIERWEQENRDKEAVSPIPLDEQDEGSPKTGKQQEGSLSEPADVGHLPVLVERNMNPNEAPLDKSRSTLSSGSVSVIGLDMDIRNNSRPNSDLGSMGVSNSISDQRHGEHRPIDGLQASRPPDLCEFHSGDHNGCHSEAADTQSNYNVKPVLIMREGDKDINDHNSNISLNENSKSVSLCGGNLEANNKELVQASIYVSKMQESVSGNTKSDNLPTAKASVDNSFIEAISTETSGEAINKALHLAKDRTESNSSIHNLTSSYEEIVPTQKQVKVCGDLDMLNVNLEKSVQLNGAKDESCLSMQLARNTEDIMTFQKEGQSEDSVQSCELATQKFKNIDELHIPSTGLKPSQSTKEAPIRNPPAKGEKLTDLTNKSSVLQNEIRQMDHNGTKYLQESRDEEDQNFALVESYLVTVVEDRSELGDEEDTSNVDPASDGADGKQEAPEDPARRESPSNRAACADDEDLQQWTAAKAYRCHVISDDGQGSDVQGELAGSSICDVSGRASGLFATGRKAHLELPFNANWGELSGPHLHRFHELDFHECEGGFAIINEEEEGDAVFVNDTGAMLSPSTRRGKIYPFSLSPIFEEESGREDTCSEDLPDLPVTQEDLRSVEQQASSILSLLQSVSERLQSSVFNDPYPDSSDELSPTLRPPPWGCLSDHVDEDVCSTNNALNALSHTGPDKWEGSPDRQYVNNDAGSSSQVDRHSGEVQVAVPAPPQRESLISAPPYDSTAVSKSPFYEYLKNARCQVTKPDVDNNQPHSKNKLCQGDRVSSAPVNPIFIDRSFKKVISRPTKMHIYEGVTFSGEKREINTDVEDATGLAFPHGASIRVLRGCWLLYRDPGFRGPCVVLEEGEKVLSPDGGVSWLGGSPSAVTIGSIKRAVKDDSTPEILVRTWETGESLSTAVDDLGTRGSVRLSSLSVKSGCWVAYECTGFSGNHTVLEAGGSISPGPHGQPLTCVRSLRPLRMGGLKVRRPLDPKMVVYEQPCFGGQSREILGNTPRLGADPGPPGASSLRVVGGVWVGYSGESYRGRQYLLEEGEHPECLEPGGSDQALLSFRFLQADFIEPSISLRSGLDSLLATQTDIVDLDVPDLEQAGSAGRTDCICVNSGVWVAYSERSFCGKQCVLEKGVYEGDLDWGGTTGSPASIRAVRMERSGGEEPKYLLRAYSQPHYQGESQEYDGEAPNCTSSLPMSFRVIWGNWLLFDEEGCTGNQFVLGEGLYPDLISCGCVATSVKSLKPIPYSFSDPSISLYSLDSFEGLETVVLTPSDSMNNFFTQSLRVYSGLWVAYEYSHFKGRQMLLQPGDFPAWGDHSGWDTIGSLYPLKQPKVYIQVRNRALGSLLTAEILKDDVPPAKVSLSPARGLDSQCWVFCGGLLKCKASKACLSLIGGKAVSGACVALWAEHGRTHQKWSLNENGTISSHLNHTLVLDIKGGTGFDKERLVANEFTGDLGTQYWDIEMV
ncbi:uncharacterized protein LOC135263319 isoform X1 [Anguilla rostrata]|uniref:uncharacterized protein LOC135263319 isoform X1 n=1 Tax=Anguilla rostrata TaxID=7938 RepID=UPI0030CF5A9C